MVCRAVLQDRERITRQADPRLLAIPTSRSRVCRLRSGLRPVFWDWLPLAVGDPLYRPLYDVRPHGLWEAHTSTMAVQRVANREGEQSQKTGRSPDRSLQLDCVKSESLVIADQLPR